MKICFTSGKLHNLDRAQTKRLEIQDTVRYRWDQSNRKRRPMEPTIFSWFSSCSPVLKGPSTSTS